jgi:hypothetical protein
MVPAELWLVKVNALALTALTWLHMSKLSMLSSENAMNGNRNVRARKRVKGAEDKVHVVMLNHGLQAPQEAEEAL